MTSTHRTTLAKRIGQCVAATTLMAGIAFGATPIAGAERVWDLDEHDKCIRNIEPNLSIEEHQHQIYLCCIKSGGVWHVDLEIDDAFCTAPPPEVQVPEQPQQTTTPPVLQNPPAQPSTPLIPTPRGPNSGTLG